jgi:excinuclease ABC subunit B
LTSKSDKLEKKEAKKLSRDEKAKLAEELTKQMKDAAKILDFERAAYLRDKIASLRLK